MGQGKEPGSWEEMGLGSLPEVTWAMGYATWSTSTEAQGAAECVCVCACLGGGAAGRAPDSWPGAPFAVRALPPYLLTCL